MAVPALKFEPERPVEERVSRLENNVEHILSDVGEIKATVSRLEDKIDHVQTTLSGKIDSLRDVVSNLAVTVANQATNAEKTIGALSTRMEKGFGELRDAITANRVWTLTIIGVVFSAAVGAVAWLLKNTRFQ